MGSCYIPPMPPSPIPAYLKEIARIQSGGEFTEHSFRGVLQKLTQALLPGVDITNEPGRIMPGGAPDYVLKRNAIPLGYIEAKNIDKSLDDGAHRAQLRRYVESLDNLIFTNYLEFRFHRNNEMKPAAAVSIAELRAGKIKPLPQNFVRFADLIQDFGAYQGRTIATAADLARCMADKARMLARVIADALGADEKNAAAASEENSELQRQLKAFRETLIADIRPAEFAGIYAQTVAYGMFAARPSTRNFPNRLGKDANVYLASSELAAVAGVLGRLPSAAEYMAEAGELNTMAADIYRHLKFNEIDLYNESADSVRVAAPAA